MAARVQLDPFPLYLDSLAQLESGALHLCLSSVSLAALITKGRQRMQGKKSGGRRVPVPAVCLLFPFEGPQLEQTTRKDMLIPIMLASSTNEPQELLSAHNMSDTSIHQDVNMAVDYRVVGYHKMQ